MDVKDRLKAAAGNLGNVAKKAKIKKVKIEAFMRGEGDLTSSEVARITRLLEAASSAPAPPPAPDPRGEPEKPANDTPFDVIEGRENFAPFRVGRDRYVFKGSRFVDEDGYAYRDGTALHCDMYLIIGLGVAYDPVKMGLNMITKPLDEHVVKYGLTVSPLVDCDGEAAVMAHYHRGGGTRLQLKKGDPIVEARIIA